MKVSVLIFTYNQEQYIAQAVESALMQQTDFAWEILIGEDDSQDATRSICTQYAERYPDRIRLFLNDRKNVIYINGKATARWNLINSLKKNMRMTNIVVTHVMESVQRIADHVVMLHQGQVLLDGGLEDLMGSKEPLVSQFVKGDLEGLATGTSELGRYHKDLLV